MQPGFEVLNLGVEGVNRRDPGSKVTGGKSQKGDEQDEKDKG